MVFVGLVGRLGYLQIVRHADLAQMAERQYSRTVVLPARRGPILDRHGAALATSTPAESLFVQPRFVGRSRARGRAPGPAARRCPSGSCTPP